MRRARAPQQHTAGIDENLNRGMKLFRMFSRHVEVLHNLRSKGEQRMIVEHVHVHNGGQAIVGSINQGSNKSSWAPHELVASYVPVPAVPRAGRGHGSCSPRESRAQSAMRVDMVSFCPAPVKCPAVPNGESGHAATPFAKLCLRLWFIRLRLRLLFAILFDHVAHPPTCRRCTIPPRLITILPPLRIMSTEDVPQEATPACQR